MTILVDPLVVALSTDERHPRRRPLRPGAARRRPLGAVLDGLRPADLTAVVEANVSLNGTNDIDEPRRAGRPARAAPRLARPARAAGLARRTRLEHRLHGRPGHPRRRTSPGEPRRRARSARGGRDRRRRRARPWASRSSSNRRGWWLRATVTNTGDERFTVDALTLAMPLPAGLDELLDFAGRWGTNARRSGGRCTRHPRRARTAAAAPVPTARYVLHAGAPGFGFERRRGVGGPHGVERQPRALRGEGLHRSTPSSAAASCSCRARFASAPGESYTSPWVFFVHGAGLGCRRAPVPPAPARPAPAGRDRPPGDAQRVGGGLLRPPTRRAWSSSPSAPPGSASSASCSTTGGSAARRHDRAGLGDWVVSTRRSGRTGCTRSSTGSAGSGMQFGLWFEPEMVNPDSDVARAHPDWMLAARRRLPVPRATSRCSTSTVPERLRARHGPDGWRCSPSTTSGTSSGTTTATSSRPGSQPDARAAGVHRQTAGRVPPARRDPRRALPTSRSSPAPPAARGSTSASSSAPTGCGSPTSSTRSSGSRCCAGPRSSSRPSTWARTSRPTARTRPGAGTTCPSAPATAVFGHLGIEWDLTEVDDAPRRDRAVGHLLQGAPPPAARR